MSLRGRYELQSPISEGPVAFDQFVDGKEKETGRPVSVHILAGGSNPENQTLLSEIGQLPPEYKVVFLETGDYQGSPFVVTDALSGALPFRKWFASLQAMQTQPRQSETQDLLRHSAWQIPVQVSAKTAASQPQEPGEFTRMFQVPQPAIEQTSEPVKVAMAPVPASRSEEPSEPGEFTRILQAQPPPAVPKQATTAKPQAETGEFTQLFQALTPIPAPAKKESEQDQPGEFTRIFQVPPVAPKPLVSELQVQLPPPSKQVDPDATLIFQAAPKPQQPAASAGEFTQMFASPQQSARSSPRDVIPDDFPQITPVPPASSQAGEFTRMMESPLSRAGLKPQKFMPASPDAVSMKGESSGFTRMLESPVSQRSEAPSPPVVSRQEKPSGEATRAFRFPETPQQTPPPATPQKGPSEFTQMFQAPQKEAEPKLVKPAVKPQRVIPRRKKDAAYLKWILVASGILLVVALIIFFAVRD